MTHFRRIALLMLAPLIATAPFPAAGQPQGIETQENYVHAPTGMTFPMAVGAFRRLNINDYSRDGQNVSASYQLGEGPDRIVVTVYIYPAPPVLGAGNVAEARQRLCDEEFDLMMSQIAAHPGARVVKRDSIPSPSDRYQGDGQRVIFALDSMGSVQGPLRSEADLFCYIGNRWSIKYRTTARAEVDYDSLLADLMRRLVWPSFPETEAAASMKSPTAGLRPASAPHP